MCAVIYLDATALGRMIASSPETPPLLSYLRSEPSRAWFTCALARVDLLRLAAQTHPQAEERAREVLASCDLVAVTDRLIDAAAGLRPTPASTSQALHLAAAVTAGSRLHALVTYDPELANAARQHHISVISPGGALCYEH